jgi:Protein of unknown function (DUF1761)
VRFTLIAIAQLAGTAYCLADGTEDAPMRMNWVAILVATIAHWLLGAVWFTAFSKPWTAGLRMPKEELDAAMAHPNFWPYVIAFVCNMVLAFVIARVLALSETHTLIRGVRIGILIGLATAAALVTAMVFELLGLTFILISAGYPLAGCILMGIIIGAWRHKAKAGPLPEVA